MRLSKLFIRAFKGIDEFSLIPEGRNMTVRGKNGTGKTTIADAYAWLMTGKGFDGKTIDTQIKRRAEDGSTPNDGGIEHTVEGVFITDDKTRYVIFSRTFKEKWEKKRGTAEQEFRGHTSDFAVDGVPMSKKEYDKKVEEMTGGEKPFQFLSMPLQFCTALRWDKRREILIDMCGTVTDDDVIKSSDELVPLRNMLNGHSVEEFRKVLQSEFKKTNEAIKSIPARIDELSKMQTQDIAMSKEKATAELIHLQELRTKKQKKLVQLEEGGEAGELQKQLAAIEADMTRFKTQFEDSYHRKTMEAQRVINGSRSEIEQLGSDIERDVKKISQLHACIETSDKLAAKLRKDWKEKNSEYKEVNSKEAAFDVSDTCPYCGQKLPPEKLKEAGEKAVQAFNLEKSRRLKEIQLQKDNINQQGKQIVIQNKRDAETIKEFQDRNKERQTRIDELANKIKEAQNALDGAEKPDVGGEPEYLGLQKKWELVNARLTAHATDNETEITGIQSDLQTIENDIGFRDEILASYRQQANIAKRIDELKEEEAELGGQIAELNRKIYLTEQFTRAKVHMTEEGINSHFQYVHWKMFNQRINGALEECCEPMIDGVPFSDGLNKGNRMKAALDILNALSKFYGRKLPVFIDDCESYTSLPDVDTQVIKLIADKSSDTLSVEVEG